jgi:nitric oxide reductase subunit B
MNVVRWIDQRKHWWKVFALIFVVSVAVVLFIGYNTYQSAPPYCDFRPGDQVVFSRADIEEGQLAFKRNALMDYGSYLGDGGPLPDPPLDAFEELETALDRAVDGERLDAKRLARYASQSMSDGLQSA